MDSPPYLNQYWIYMYIEYILLNNAIIYYIEYVFKVILNIEYSVLSIYILIYMFILNIQYYIYMFVCLFVCFSCKTHSNVSFEQWGHQSLCILGIMTTTTGFCYEDL